MHPLPDPAPAVEIQQYMYSNQERYSCKALSYDFCEEIRSEEAHCLRSLYLRHVLFPLAWGFLLRPCFGPDWRYQASGRGMQYVVAEGALRPPICLGHAISLLPGGHQYHKLFSVWLDFRSE